MCGIIGVARFGELNDSNLRASALYLGTNLLETTEVRGKDATGVSALFDDGNFFGQKMGVSANEFIARFGGKKDDFDGLLSVLREYKAGLRLFIGHCRKKSAGSLKNVDNHPIKVGNIIGLHNGTLKNHDEIFKNLDCDRDGEVDSEAIFRLLHHFTNECKVPFTLDILEETTKRLEGSFSILAFNANNPNQLVSARDARPAEYCLIKPLKMVLIASDDKFIKKAIWDYNKLAYLHNTDKFVKLRESDVEFATLKDDTIALFDLTKEITTETKITELYDTRSIPKAINRIWKEAVTTNDYTNNFNRTYGSGYGKTTTKTDDKNKTTTTTTIVTDKTTTKNDKAGSVWSSKLNQYVKISDPTSDLDDGVVLNTEKKRRMSIEQAEEENKTDTSSIEDNETTNVPLVKQNTSVEEFETGNSAEITIIKVDKEALETKKKLKTTSILDNMKAGIEKGKEASRDEGEAMKAAAEAVKETSKFNTLHEVAEMCRTDADSLNELSITSLANRILKSLFSNFFVQGWISKCDRKLEINHSLNNDNKLTKAQKHIRVLKQLTSYFDELACTTPVAGGSLNEQLHNREERLKKVNKVITSNGEITEKTLKDIFSSNDFRTNKCLKDMMITLQAK